MTEYEQAEQDVAAAKVAERIAEWKAMEAKASYYRYASEAMAASAEVMGSRIRRDNALAAEFVEKATRASQAPAQPVHPEAELRDAPPAASEESGDQFEPDASPAEDFTLLDPALLSIDEPILDATILPQVTPDEVPPTAEVIHTDDGRKRFALFGGQTHEVVSGSGNPDADFWASVLHPKPKVDA